MVFKKLNLLYSDSRPKENTMKLKKAYLIALLLVTLLFTGHAVAIQIDFKNNHSSIRCADGIVEVGDQQQQVLEELDIQNRMEKVLVHIKKEQELLKIQKKVCLNGFPLMRWAAIH